MLCKSRCSEQLGDPPAVLVLCLSLAPSRLPSLETPSDLSGHTAGARLVPLLPCLSSQSVPICVSSTKGGEEALPGKQEDDVHPSTRSLANSLNSSWPSAVEWAERDMGHSFSSFPSLPFPQNAALPNVTFLVLPVLQLVSPDLFFYCQQNRPLKHHPEPAGREGEGLGLEGFLDPPLTPREEDVSKTNKVKTENKRKTRYDAIIFIETTLRGTVWARLALFSGARLFSTEVFLRPLFHQKA